MGQTAGLFGNAYPALETGPPTPAATLYYPAASSISMANTTESPVRRLSTENTWILSPILELIVALVWRKIV